MEPIIGYPRVGREGWKIMGGGGKSPTEYKGGEGDYRKSTSS